MSPVWLASPPEVHSALLSSGPGPGMLLAAAGAWNSLSAEYASAAGELTALLDGVQGEWQGVGGQAYVAAHAPYLAWLAQSSADSADVAAQHEVAAAAYSTALAAMPTLAELGLNHAVHGVLVATNFFGLNTIPIALNEADYVRMWIQAATTMGAYQAVSGMALASAPRITAAPPVLKADSAPVAADPPGSDFFTTLWNQLVQLFQNPQETIAAILANPAAWFPLLFFIGYEAFFIPFGFTFWSLLLSSPALLLPLVIGLGMNTLLNGQSPVVPVPGTAPPLTVTQAEPAHPAVVAGTAGTSAAPVGSAGASGATAANAAPATGAASLAYVVGGAYSDAGPGPTLIDREATKAPASTIPAAAAGLRASGRAKARVRRRRHAVMRDFGDEFMDLDSGPALSEQPSGTGTSDRGGGPLGFAGTSVKQRTAVAGGLATLTGDDFGGGPPAPMMPDTWGRSPTGNHEANHEANHDDQHTER